MRFSLPLIVILSIVLFARCERSHPEAREFRGRVTQILKKPDGGYQLYWHGKPYFIKGAGAIKHFSRLKECGGNSVRTWSDLDAKRILDSAQALGMSVMLGLWMERESEGFDYDDGRAVAEQRERIKRTILKYKDHPALLMWCVGNEWALHALNFKVFDEMNHLAEMTHELDPDHPVTTSMTPNSPRAVTLLRERCPAIDVLAVNVYGILAYLDHHMDEGGWRGPYLLSEYGVRGYWEPDSSVWEAPIEANTDRKVGFMRYYAKQYLTPPPPGLLGSYIFYWGTKQEESHTWYSLFDEAGRESPLVGFMQEFWTGRPPANQAPSFRSFTLNGSDKPAFSLPQASPGGSTKSHTVAVDAVDPDGDPLTYEWEVRPRAASMAEFHGAPIEAIPGRFDNPKAARTTFRLPEKPGIYRVFVHVYDNHNHMADANFLLRVTPARSVVGRR